jgi:hypothetical protein
MIITKTKLIRIIREELSIVSEVALHDAGPGSYHPGVTDEIETAGSLAVGTEILSALGNDIFNDLVEKIKTYLRDPGSPIVTKISSELENNRQLNEIIDRIGDNFENTDALREQEEDVPELNITSLDELSEMTVNGRALISQEDLASLRRTAGRILADGLIVGSADALSVEPTAHDWVMAIMSNGVREFSFGVVDNVVLVFVGDRIEAKFQGKRLLSRNVLFRGRAYPIVMVGFIAAGLGNAVSDGLGAIVAGPILDEFGIDPEKYVTETQLENAPWLTRTAFRSAGIIGVILGCIVGMIPAFFLSSYRLELAAAGFVWGAEATGLASRVPLVGRITGAARWLATPITAMTAAGVLAFTGWALALGTLGWGAVAWAELENRLGRNNAKAFLSAQKRVLLSLGIFTSGTYNDPDDTSNEVIHLRNVITAGDADKFKDRIKNDLAAVNTAWKNEMLKLGNDDPESFDIPKIKDAIRDASAELGLDYPWSDGSIQSGNDSWREGDWAPGTGGGLREQWLKIAGII